MRAVRRILLGLGVALLVLILAVGGAFLFVTGTDPGRGWLAARLNALLATPGEGGISVGRVEGGLPGRIALRDIAFSDAQGVWMTIDAATVDWSPLALLSGTLAVDLAEATGVHVARLPAGGEEPEPQPEEPFRWPTLPVELQVERFALRDVRLAEPVVGVAASLQAEGRLAARESGAVSAALTVERTDGAGGRLQAEADYAPADDMLRLSAVASEPEGGLVAGLLGLPDRPPVSLRIAGEGPLSAWQGQVAAELGAAAGLTADLTLGRDGGGYALDAEGRARLAPLVPPALRPLLGDGVAFAVEARTRGAATVEIARARLASSAATATLSATLDLDRDRVEGEADAALLDAAALQPLVAPAAVEGAELRLRFAGPLLSPEVTAETRAGRIALPQAELREVTATLSVAPSAPLDAGGFRGAVTAAARAGTVQVQAGPQAAAPLLAGPLTLDLRAQADTAAGEVRIERLAIDNPQLRVAANGAIDLGARAGTLDAEASAASLASLSPLLGLPVTGAAELSATVRAGAGLSEVRAEVTGAVRDLASPQAPLAAIFGRRTTLRADLGTGDGGVHRFDLRVDAAAADLTAKGALSPDFGRIDAEYRVAVADLKPLSAAAGADLAGSAVVTGTIEGPTADPTVTAALKGERIMAAQQPLGAVEGRLRLRTPASAPQGHVEIAAHPPAGRAAVAADFAVADQRLRLTDLRIETRGETFLGQFAVPLAGGPIEGNLSGRIDDLGGLLAFFGAEGDGTGTVRLRLFGERGLQAAEASIDLRGVRVVAGDPRNPVSIARVSAEGRATAADPARGNLRLAVTDLRSGAARIDTLTFTASGSERNVDYALQARGEAEGPLRLDASGTARLREDGAVAVTLARLQGVVKEQRIAARRPARIVWGPDRLAVEDLELGLASGVLRADATLAGSNLSGTVDLEALPLPALRAFAPDLRATGAVSARVRLSGRLPNPSGTAVVSFDKVRFAAARELRPLEGRIEADWRGGQLDLRATVGGFARQPLQANLRLPFRLAEDLTPVIPPNGPVAGSLAWQGEVEPLFLLLPLDDHRLRGIATVALGVTGTVARPQATGSVELTRGAYENLTTGTLVDRIALRAEAEGDRIAITRFSARDGADGTLQATGYAALSGAPVEVNLVLDDFTVTRRDDVTAETDADLRFVRGERGGRLSGTITTTAVEVRLVNRLPPQVVELDPVEKGRGGRTAPAPAKATSAAPAEAPDIELAVDVSMPRRVFARGRGLDSEWAGNFAIRGTAGDPQIHGALRVVRGRLTLLNNTLELRPSSEIRLAKTGRGGFEAVLDITATDEIEDLTVVARVTGTAAAPKLSFTSEPELPQDEVLARILFGKNTGELTPVEAVQLAAAVAELTGVTGGTGGVLDVARRSLGLDVLRVGAGGNGRNNGTGARRQNEDKDQPAATVTAGKYITKNVFVGVEQGTAPGSSAATVEIEVLPHVSLQSRIDQEGASNIGVKAEWDY